MTSTQAVWMIEFRLLQTTSATEVFLTFWRFTNRILLLLLVYSRGTRMHLLWVLVCLLQWSICLVSRGPCSLWRSWCHDSTPWVPYQLSVVLQPFRLISLPSVTLYAYIIANVLFAVYCSVVTVNALLYSFFFCFFLFLHFPTHLLLLRETSTQWSAVSSETFFRKSDPGSQN